MKKLLIRSLTGILYAIVLIGALFVSRFTFFALFAIVLTFTLWEFYRLCYLNGYEPQVFSGITFALLFYAGMFLLQYNLFTFEQMLPYGLLALLIPFAELTRKKKEPVENMALTFAGIMLTAIPFSFFNLIPNPPINESGAYNPWLMIGVFVIIWTNDTGAYLIGSMIGKNKLAEKISPNKTWEGAIGGAVFAILFAILYFHFTNLFTPVETVFISLATVIAGTMGDLTESLIKRNFNVKDSGNMLPGHGGLLDRFDSLLFAAPVYYVMIISFLK